MHGTVPSWGAPFGHMMLSGTAVPSFEVATSRRASMFEKSTGNAGVKSGRVVSLPVFAANRVSVDGVVYEENHTSTSPRHAIGGLADDTDGPTGAFCGLPASENARTSDGPPS